MDERDRRLIRHSLITGCVHDPLALPLKTPLSVSGVQISRSEKVQFIPAVRMANPDAGISQQCIFKDFRPVEHDTGGEPYRECL
jgi:hypothetical protein